MLDVRWMCDPVPKEHLTSLPESLGYSCFKRLLKLGSTALNASNISLCKPKKKLCEKKTNEKKVSCLPNPEYLLSTLQNEKNFKFRVWKQSGQSDFVGFFV